MKLKALLKARPPASVWVLVVPLFLHHRCLYWRLLRSARKARLDLIRKTVALNSRPCLSGVRSSPNTRARTATIKTPRGPPALIRCCVKRFVVDRIHHEIGEASVLIDEFRVVPGFATVGCLIDSALFVWSKQVAQHRDVNHVRISRINNDSSDRLRIRETHLGESLAGVR